MDFLPSLLFVGKRSPERNLNNRNQWIFFHHCCLFVYLFVCTKALDKEVGPNAEREAKDCLNES